MSRPRLYVDAAAKQKAYRDRIQTRRRAIAGPTETDLAHAVGALHIRLEYEAAVHPAGPASRLVGSDALVTFRNVVRRLSEVEPF
jgi:hypothetical protein